MSCSIKDTLPIMTLSAGLNCWSEEHWKIRIVKKPKKNHFFTIDSKITIVRESICWVGRQSRLFVSIGILWELPMENQYRDSPDSTVFVPPGNRTIAKTVLIGDWFSIRNAVYDLWNIKVPFLLIFTRILKVFWSLKLKKCLSCLILHVYWEIQHKVWLLDNIFIMD